MMKDTVKTFLETDSTLMALVPGGIHVTREITRQGNAGAFDANGEIQASLLLKEESDTQSGPYAAATKLYLVCFVYAGSRAILDRLFTLLHQHKFDGAWDCRWTGDVLDLEDQALGCDLALSRFEIVRMRS